MKLFSGILVAGTIGLSLAFTAPTFAAGVGENFSIDEGVVAGSFPNVVTGIDKVNFTYTALIDQTNNGGVLNGDAFVEKGFAQWGAYVNDAAAVIPSQLNSLEIGGGYKVYMVFTALGTAAFNGIGITATFTSFEIDIFLDSSSNTVLTLPADGIPGNGDIPGNVAKVGDGEDQLLASANLISVGEAHLFGGLAAGDFEIQVTDLGLELFGESFFTDPSPFYSIMNFAGNTGTVTPPGSINAPFTSVATGDGQLFFQVPEPGTLGLLGGGLLGAAAFLRRRKAAKAA